MSQISTKTIHLWVTKNFDLSARLTPHAQKLFNFFGNYLRRYFRRLWNELVLLSPLILLAVLLLNLQIPKTAFEVQKEESLYHPKNPTSHILLASQLAHTNQFQEAEQELNQAISLVSSPLEKEKLENQLEIIGQKRAEPKRLQSEIIFWQKFLLQYPTFRDAYLKLSILNWKLYRPFESQKFLHSALSIDPNNESIRKIKSTLESK